MIVQGCRLCSTIAPGLVGPQTVLPGDGAASYALHLSGTTGCGWSWGGGNSLGFTLRKAVGCAPLLGKVTSQALCLDRAPSCVPHLSGAEDCYTVIRGLCLSSVVWWGCRLYSVIGWQGSKRFSALKKDYMPNFTVVWAWVNRRIHWWSHMHHWKVIFFKYQISIPLTEQDYSDFLFLLALWLEIFHRCCPFYSNSWIFCLKFITFPLFVK